MTKECTNIKRILSYLMYCDFAGETGGQPNMYNACQSNPCLNGAACQPFVNGFEYKCNCINSWSGQRCDTSRLC